MIPALKRRWIWFSLLVLLWTLLLVATQAAISRAWLVAEIDRVNHRKAVRKEMEQAGGNWENMFLGEPRAYERWALSYWLAGLLGDRNQYVIKLPGGTSDADQLRVRNAFPEAYILIEDGVSNDGRGRWLK